MRANQSFAYIIEVLPTQKLIFEFIQKHGPIDDEEAYGNLNMGAGFAFYISEADVNNVWDMLKSYEYLNRFGVCYAGHIERSDEKKVVIKPKNLEYSGTTLGVR